VKEHMKKIAIFAAIMVVGAGVALGSTLSVPFYLDSQSNNKATTAQGGNAGRIGLKEGSGVDQTLTIIYTALNASDVPTDQTETFPIGANQQLRFNPVQSNTAETAGDVVPNVTITGSGGGTQTAGSAIIISSIAGSITGVYSEIDFARSATSAHVLLPQ
jgi:hypothetical protein